jgi:hypothetical protein
MPISRAFLYISFRVPSKGAFLQVPLTDHPLRENLRFQSPPSSVSQESPVNKTPPGSPPGTLWRELPIFRAFFYVSLGFPIKSSSDRKIAPFFLSPWERSFPSWVPSKGDLPEREGGHLPSLVNEPRLQVPQWGLYGEMPISKAFFYTSPDKNKISPFSQSP